MTPDQVSTAARTKTGNMQFTMPLVDHSPFAAPYVGAARIYVERGLIRVVIDGTYLSPAEAWEFGWYLMSYAKQLGYKPVIE